MLAKRIIPTILMKNGLMVKGEMFKADRVVGNALQAARIHAMRGVDELMILDVTATKEEREPNYHMIEQLTSRCTIPVTVGGGINHMNHVQKLLNAGADKVCIGAEKPIIPHIAKKYGSQAVVASVDVDIDLDYLDGTISIIEEMEGLGAGEILLQNRSLDGTMGGFDLQLVDCANYTGLPVIASGGCSGYDDMRRAFKAGADAVAVGALFQFTDATPQKAAQYLDSLGVEVRYEAR